MPCTRSALSPALLIVSESPKNEEIILEGIAASPGIAHGEALLYLQKELDVPSYEIKEAAVEKEIERFDQALLETRQQISAIRNKIAASLGEAEAQIFDAHLLVLDDYALIEEVTSEVRNSRRNVESCYDRVARRYLAFFNSMEDEYLRERVADIRDVSRRVLHNLLGMRKPDLEHLAESRVVVSEDLSPSDTAGLNREMLLGIVTDAGGRTSHSVIMARSLGIPAVVGLHDATGRIANGDTVLVDGYDGVVVIHPSDERLYQYGKRVSARRRLEEVYATTLEEPCETKDGVRLALMANIEGSQDMENAAAKHAEGIGLFRTEGIFLRHNGYPPEQVQFEEYDAVARAAGEKPVIIRTLDLGGDKSFGDETVREENPFMGFRAIRFCLKHTGIFETQLRAILRASVHGNVKLMYPMISGVGELVQANAILDSVKAVMRRQGEAFDEEIEVGAMIELPSAACVVDLIAGHADFLSIGSNDLIQYLLAVDRLNDRVAHLYEPTHPAVLRTIKAIVEGGEAAGTPVSVCGEIAGDPLFLGLLAGMGVGSLSLTSNMLPEVKFLLRRMEVGAARALALEVLEMNDPGAVLSRLKDFRCNLLGDLTKEPREESAPGKI